MAVLIADCNAAHSVGATALTSAETRKLHALYEDVTI